MDIICRSLDTAIETLANWFQCSKNHIVDYLSYNWWEKFETYLEYCLEQENHDGYNTYFGEFLYYNLNKPHTSINISEVRIHWFHGTRCLEKGVYDCGIRPLQEIFPYIKEMLDKLAFENGISFQKENVNFRHFQNLIFHKFNNDGDKGPCAVLNYDTLINPQKYGFHDYIKSPEIIEDYAYSAYGINGDALLEIYRNITQPAIVEFYTFVKDANNMGIEHIIGILMEYVYYTLHNLEVGLTCNTCYTGKGKGIAKEQILNIDYI